MAKSASAIDTSKVKAANNAYYSALSKRDIHAMEKVWSRTSDNILIAPPTNRSRTWDGTQLSVTGKHIGQRSATSPFR